MGPKGPAWANIWALASATLLQAEGQWQLCGIDCRFSDLQHRSHDTRLVTGSGRWARWAGWAETARLQDVLTPGSRRFLFKCCS